jgi:hypothetical protein
VAWIWLGVATVKQSLTVANEIAPAALERV